MRAIHYAAASAAVLLAACGLGGPSYPSFEGASYRIEGMTASPDSAEMIPTTIYRDGPKMRVETVLPTRGRAVIVFDRAANAAYVLSQTPAATAPAAAPGASTAPAAAPPAATATTPPAGAAAAPPVTTTTPPTTAPTTTAPAVAGVAIRVADADAPQPMELAWSALGEKGARFAGECQVAGESGNSWRPREADNAAAIRTACITDDGIVLRVAEGDRVIFEATGLTRGPQDPGLFGVPAGYQTVDPEAVVNEVGEAMNELDGVTGDGAPPPTAAQPPAQ